MPNLTEEELLDILASNGAPYDQITDMVLSSSTRPDSVVLVALGQTHWLSRESFLEVALSHSDFLDPDLIRIFQQSARECFRDMEIEAPPGVPCFWLLVIHEGNPYYAPRWVTRPSFGGDA